MPSSLAPVHKASSTNNSNAKSPLQASSLRKSSISTSSKNISRLLSGFLTSISNGLR